MCGAVLDKKIGYYWKLTFYPRYHVRCFNEESPTPQPLSLTTTNLFSESASLGFVCIFFWIPHISKILWYLSFSLLLISLSIMHSRSIYAVTNGWIFWLNFIYVYKNIYYIHFIYIVLYMYIKYIIILKYI